MVLGVMLHALGIRVGPGSPLGPLFPSLFLLTIFATLALMIVGLIDKFLLNRAKGATPCPRVWLAIVALACTGGLLLSFMLAFGGEDDRLRKQVYEAFQARDYERSIALSTKLIERGNNYFFLTRSRAYSKKGDLDKAIADAGEFILSEELSLGHEWRAVLYLRKHDDDRALDDLTKAIETDPKYAGTYYRRAAVYHRLGRQAEAEKDYAEGKRLDPSYPHDLDEPDERFLFTN
jgi:tetratricopeptide (TPR) repeat protein